MKGSQIVGAFFTSLWDGHPAARRFEEKINSEEVREYFETLGLDVWDAWSFFKLLDKESQRRTSVVPFALVHHDLTWNPKASHGKPIQAIGFGAHSCFFFVVMAPWR